MQISVRIRDWVWTMTLGRAESREDKDEPQLRGDVFSVIERAEEPPPAPEQQFGFVRPVSRPIRK